MCREQQRQDSVIFPLQAIYHIVSTQEQPLHLPCVKAVSRLRIIQRLGTQTKANDIILFLERHLQNT